MISILIPTYNYEVLPLVENLQLQCEKAKIEFEIIVLDDASPNFEIVTANKRVSSLKNCRFLVEIENKGRTLTRQNLAEMAKYNLLLFLDADVLPKHDNFIDRFRPEDNYDVQFGGIEYEEKRPANTKILRWKYGREREQLSVDKRKRQPYLTINSGAFLIKKQLFLELNSQMVEKKYGMDLLFKQLLENRKAKVFHLDNPILHLGLESSQLFLEKSLQAVKTLCMLEDENRIKTDLSPLQKSYHKLEKMKLTSFFSFVVSRFRKKMERNFLSSNPNLFWFDLYRLNYYIQLKKK